MDLRRLEAFSKVYELRSFSKAGEQLYLSQPTISAHIASLERLLDVRLFDRLGRAILPTAAADILYQYAVEAFRNLQKAKAEIQLLQDHVSGYLELGGSTIPAHYLLPDMLSLFLKRYPEVTVHVSVGDTKSIISDVLSGKLVAGVVGGASDASDLTFVPILEDELVIIAAPNVASTVQELQIKDLFDYSWVMREPGSGTRQAFERGLQKSDVDIRKLKTSVMVESTQAVLRCVRAGLGLSITSRLVAQGELERGELQVIKCPSLDVKRSFYCTYQQRRHMFPAVRYFLEFLQEQAKEYANKVSR